MGFLDNLIGPDETGVVWFKAKSAMDNEFEIGVKFQDLKSRVASIEAGKAGADTAPTTTLEGDNARAMAVGPWVPVHWVVGDHRWITPTVDAEAIGISRYSLSYNGFPNVYSYTLDFTNTKGWGFDFKDEEGDVYHVATFLNSDHYVKYNSAKPTIVAVRQA